jgi:hypothetical protein
MAGELRKRSERATMLARRGEPLQVCISRDDRVIVVSAKMVDELAIPGQAITDSAKFAASWS